MTGQTDAAAVIDLGRAIADRGSHAMAMQDQARSVGGCEQPVRVAGRGTRVDTATGEVLGTWSTDDLPDGTLLVRCKDRRRSRCEPCSRLYQDDAYQLTRAGLAGGKGVPASVAAHPAVFLTLTAPSFGPVHGRRLGRDGRVVPCRARRDLTGQTCPHGLPLTCTRRHAEDDEVLGTALCGRCFDYGGAVAFNHHASELWRRTTIRIYRELATARGMAEADVKREVRLSYVKVAEWQRRGLIHFHVALRLDARTKEPSTFDPPPASYDLAMLDWAIRAAVARVSVPHDTGLTDRARPLPRWLPDDVAVTSVAPRRPATRWGQQLDARPIEPAHLVAIEDQLRQQLDAPDTHTAAAPLSRRQIAGYLAKYATKDTEVLAQVRPGLDVQALADLPATAHVRRLAVCAWAQARAWPADDERHRRLRRWTHQFGHGGHYLTKSRRYSTTFRDLRQARHDWRLAQRQRQRAADAERRRVELGHAEYDHRADDEHHDPDRVALVAQWRLHGIGWRLPGDAELARGVRARSREQRRVARDEVYGTTAAARTTQYRSTTPERSTT